MRSLAALLPLLIFASCSHSSDSNYQAPIATPSVSIEAHNETSSGSDADSGALSKIEQERSANWPDPSSQQGINWRAFQSGSLDRLNLHCVLFCTIDPPSNGHVYLSMTPCGGGDKDTPEVTVDADSDLAKAMAGGHSHIATVSLIHHADYFHIDRVYAIGDWTPLPDPPTPP